MKLKIKIKIRNHGWPPGKINEREQYGVGRERGRIDSINRDI